MAKTLRQGLSERNIDLPHSDCLELVARQFGVAGWNTLAATIDREQTESMLRLPEGWKMSGSRREDYDMGVDDSDRSGGALIRCKYAADVSKANGFGTLMQSIMASDYLGKRVMLSARLKTRNVDGAATLWMRVDGKQGDSLRFDNMESRTTDGAISGTKDWSARLIVLDVPDDADSIHFGFYLRGNGSAWARDFDISEVGGEIAETDGSRPARSKPINLDFS
jgi:hypothetical protein